VATRMSGKRSVDRRCLGPEFAASSGVVRCRPDPNRGSTPNRITIVRLASRPRGIEIEPNAPRPGRHGRDISLTPPLTRAIRDGRIPPRVAGFGRSKRGGASKQSG